MEVEPPRATAAPAPPTPAEPPSFRAEICACIPTTLQEQLVALEAANMAGFERNGEPFAAYFRRWDLTAHVITLASGELAGFAISGAEGRGKVFLYELHVAAAHRHRGYASALLELVERSSTSRSASAVTVELNVHRANASARGFYERVGFAESGTTSGGDVLVMRRRR
jgi:ribosomal protein S18 acetylase RimI-like enzyme